jgi:hypothetical protein
MLLVEGILYYYLVVYINFVDHQLRVQEQSSPQSLSAFASLLNSNSTGTGILLLLCCSIL